MKIRPCTKVSEPELLFKSLKPGEVFRWHSNPSDNYLNLKTEKGWVELTSGIVSEPDLKAYMPMPVDIIEGEFVEDC